PVAASAGGGGTAQIAAGRLRPPRLGAAGPPGGSGFRRHRLNRAAIQAGIAGAAPVAAILDAPLRARLASTMRMRAYAITSEGGPTRSTGRPISSATRSAIARGARR